MGIMLEASAGLIVEIYLSFILPIISSGIILDEWLPII